jgi:hypothetical protein
VNGQPRYVIVPVRESVREYPVASAIGRFGISAGIGFALYLIITGLGFGVGGGRGSGEGRGEGRGEAPPPPPVPKDELRLEFAMFHPTPEEHPRIPMGFRGPGAKMYSLEEMIARVKAGGRADVALTIMGDVRHGSVVEARAHIKQAGIEIWEESTSARIPSRVSGNARGHYGWSV